MRYFVIILALFTSIGCVIVKKTNPNSPIGEYRYFGKKGSVEVLKLDTSGVYVFYNVYHLSKNISIGKWHQNPDGKIIFQNDSSFQKANYLIVADTVYSSPKIKIHIYSVATPEPPFGVIRVSDGVKIITAKMESQNLILDLDSVDRIMMSFNGKEYLYINTKANNKTFNIYVNFDGFSLIKNGFNGKTLLKNSEIRIKGRVFKRV